MSNTIQELVVSDYPADIPNDTKGLREAGYVVVRIERHEYGSCTVKWLSFLHKAAEPYPNPLHLGVAR